MDGASENHNSVTDSSIISVGKLLVFRFRLAMSFISVYVCMATASSNVEQTGWACMTLTPKSSGDVTELYPY